MTIRGELVQVFGIGGETTGWAIRSDTDIEVDGKAMKSIEVDPQGKRLENLKDQQVEATGTLTHRQGIERGTWPVLELHTIRERSSSKRGTMNPNRGACSDWKAWYDKQPPTPGALHVTGRCLFKTGGYTVTLEPAVPQGINPDIYLLEKVVNKTSESVTQAFTGVPVHYKERTKRQYKQVEILPDEITIDVKDAQ